MYSNSRTLNWQSCDLSAIDSVTCSAGCVLLVGGAPRVRTSRANDLLKPGNREAPAEPEHRLSPQLAARLRGSVALPGVRGRASRMSVRRNPVSSESRRVPLRVVTWRMCGSGDRSETGFPDGRAKTGFLGRRSSMRVPRRGPPHASHPTIQSRKPGFGATTFLTHARHPGSPLGLPRRSRSFTIHPPGLCSRVHARLPTGDRRPMTNPPLNAGRQDKT
jgi:hypothetical protein